MWIDIFMIAIGLSMDAFAISICKGLGIRDNCGKVSLITGVWFGGFQALMPLLGYFCGVKISRYITPVSKYVALILLSLIGLNMIRENVKSESAKVDNSLNFAIMFPLAIATSIDAFTVGITLAALHINILPSVFLIGCTTFIISSVGVFIGRFFGSMLHKQASVFGGVVLIVIGIRIFIIGG